MLKEYNWQSGDFPFQVYIDLKKVLSNKYEMELDLISAILTATRNEGISLVDKVKVETHEYCYNVIECMLFWNEQERKFLKYTPTAEEKQAGLDEYNAKVGEYATAFSLAEKYGLDPDIILEQWSWAKVFSILVADFEKYKFEKKLNEITAKKYKTK